MRPKATRMTGTRRLRPQGLAAAAAIVAAVVLMTAGGCATRSTYPPAAPPPAASRPETAPPQPLPGQPRPYKALGRWYQPLPDAKGFRQQGIASWYGPDFHGKRSSSGEIYDMHDMTAAHKTLPLGTLVRVRHLQNQRSVEVRINDRGPFVGDRIIDLSHEAARRLGVIGPGTAAVEVQAIGTLAGTPADVYSGNFTFQVGAFSSRENAERLRAELNPRFGNAHVVEFEQTGRVFYRLRVGKCTSLDEAIAYEAHLKENGFKDAFAVAE
jgi:rare lipoprotein A